MRTKEQLKKEYEKMGIEDFSGYLWTPEEFFEQVQAGDTLNIGFQAIMTIKKIYKNGTYLVDTNQDYGRGYMTRKRVEENYREVYEGKVEYIPILSKVNG